MKDFTHNYFDLKILITSNEKCIFTSQAIAKGWDVQEFNSKDYPLPLLVVSISKTEFIAICKPRITCLEVVLLFFNQKKKKCNNTFSNPG